MFTRSGFTLIELMVVIAIILILSTIAILIYTSPNIKTLAKKARAKEELHMIQIAVEAYHTDLKRYPPEINWMDELLGKGVLIYNTKEVSYISKIPKDPFSPDDYYNYSLSNGVYYIWSVGPDGENDNHADDDIVKSNR